MAVTEAHKKGNRKWDSENMTTLGCKVRKEEAERFKAYAAEKGTTANSLLKEFVYKSIFGENDEKRSE